MLDQNDRAVIGDNNPPDPIETVIAEYDGIITEAQNWADGDPVDNEAAMKAVDEVLKGFKTYKSALTKAGKERTAPLHEAWKAEVAAVKVYTDDADRLQKCLVDIVAPFKAKLAAEKEAQRKAAEAKARAEREAAEKAAREAQAGDIEAARKAAEKAAAADAAIKEANKASKETVKGMRTVTRYEITDHKDALHHIARNDRDAVTEFVEEYVRRNHKSQTIAGVRVWQEKEAF